MKQGRLKDISSYIFLVAIFFTGISAYPVIPLVIISLIIYLLKREAFALNLLDKLQIILLCSFLVSSGLAIHKGDSFIYTLGFLLYLISYFMTKWLAGDEYFLKKLTNILLYSSLILSSIAIMQFLVQSFTNITIQIREFTLVAPGRCIESLTTNPLHLVFFLNFTLPLLIILMLFENYKRILVPITIFLSISVLLIITRSTARGAFVGFLGSILIIAIMLRKRFWLLILALPILFIFIVKPARLRFLHPMKGASYERRVATNKVALRMWKEHNILIGVGGSNFCKLKSNYEGTYSNMPLLGRTHNLYTSLLVENGILGLGILLTLSVVLIIYLFQIFRTGVGFQAMFAVGLLGSFVYFFIHNMVGTTHDIVRFGILVWAGMGCVSGMKDQL